jgi:lipoprotein-anchoring transpeptidase ErfK/SrfK
MFAPPLGNLEEQVKRAVKNREKLGNLGSKSAKPLKSESDPDSIGRDASHGCIRLANWDVAKLAGMVKPGVPVVVE